VFSDTCDMTMSIRPDSLSSLPNTDSRASIICTRTAVSPRTHPSHADTHRHTPGTGPTAW
jgi:hypothetical protein